VGSTERGMPVHTGRALSGAPRAKPAGPRSRAPALPGSRPKDSVSARSLKKLITDIDGAESALRAVRWRGGRCHCMTLLSLRTQTYACACVYNVFVHDCSRAVSALQGGRPRFGQERYAVSRERYRGDRYPGVEQRERHCSASTCRCDV